MTPIKRIYSWLHDNSANQIILREDGSSTWIGVDADNIMLTVMQTKRVRKQAMTQQIVEEQLDVRHVQY